MRSLRRLLLVAGCWLLVASYYTQAQTGPGGVGNSTNNIMWLKSDAITGLINGDAVQNWLDVSGNGNNVSQATTARRPIYNTNIINGFPVVSFSSGSQHYLTGSLVGTLASPFTILTVTRFNNTTAYSYVLNLGNGNARANATVSRDHTAPYNSYYCWTGGAGYYDTPQNSLPVGETKIFDAIHTSTGTHQLFLNGVGQTVTPSGGIGTLSIPGTVNIGRRYDNTNFMLGYTSEVIIYNKQLNLAERFIVENYLAAKYALSITASGHDYFSYESTHYYDVAGIGREDASNINSSAMSSGILQVASASSLDNGDYLFFGHQNGSISSWTNTGTPTVSIYMVPRNWRFDQRGDVGTVTVLVDFATLPAAPGVWSCSNRYLIVDSDGDFSSGSTVHELSPVSGSLYNVSNITIGSGNYVSIGIGEVPAPIADAGANGGKCGILSYTFSANPSVGKGSWSLVSGPGSIVSWNPGNTSPTATVTVDSYGAYTFDPKPVVTAVNDTICNNTFTNIIPQSTTSPVRYGIRYTWTTEDVDNIINGEANSIDNGYPLGQAIIQQLNNPDNAAHRVTYHLTPWTVRADNSLHCAGDIIDIDIWIEPTPRLSVAPSDTIICDFAIVIFDVSDQNGFTAGGKFYYLTTTYDPLTISGVEANGEKPAGTDFSDQLINLTNEVQSVQYHFKARIKDPGINCESGGDTTVVIYVQPTAKLSVVVPDTVVCDSTTFTITVNDLNGNVHPSTTKVYQLTTTNPGGVIGVRPTGEYPAGDDSRTSLSTRRMQ